MVRQLMIFARADTHARRAPMDLVRSVRRTLEMCRRTMDPRIALELTTADEVPSIEGNPGQIEQVLLNICLNARDALESARTPSPRIAIHIEPATRADEVRIRVTDNGPGMTEEIRARVFEPFFTTKDVGRGTGLGLAMAYSIIADHRGRIDCETRPGQGATFEINLPVSPVELPASTDGGGIVRGGTETVLLIDDDNAVRRALREILTRSGYSVLEAADGANGVAVFEREQLRIDLVVLDRSMPQAVRRRRAGTPRSARDRHPGDPAQRPPRLGRRRRALGGGAQQADRPRDAAADGARSARSRRVRA